MDTGGGSTTHVGSSASPGVAAVLDRLRHRQPGDAHRLVGALVLTAWVAWLVITVLLQPRLVSDARFREDLASGDVVAWRAVAMTHTDDVSWVENLDLWWVTLGADGRPVDGDQPGMVTLAYATSSAPFTRVLDLTTDPLPAEYTGLLRAADVPAARTWTDAPRTELPAWAAWSGFAVGVLFLGLLLLGPRPVHGTRWFWFWFAFPTLGVGVVVYAVAEHLRRPRDLSARERGRALDVVDSPSWPDQREAAGEAAQPAGEAAAGKRRSGLAGLLFSIGLGLLTQLVLAMLLSATGWVWLVRP
ncbi:hypothetical protein [Oryzobacter terrae]|uniref:hypothetical protein n=1 Tax=Oryzobacter terrae TaxID=1620385 RepID=UPI00366DDEEE